jgi:hypothetical protein
MSYNGKDYDPAPDQNWIDFVERAITVIPGIENSGNCYVKVESLGRVASKLITGVTGPRNKNGDYTKTIEDYFKNPAGFAFYNSILFGKNRVISKTNNLKLGVYTTNQKNEPTRFRLKIPASQVVADTAAQWVWTRGAGTHTNHAPNMPMGHILG